MKTVPEELVIEEGNNTKVMNLNGLKKTIRGKVAGVKELGELSLVEWRTRGKRQGGIFVGAVSCTLIMTKDHYLHILDAENAEKPAYSFDVKRTQSKLMENDSTTVEIVDSRRNQGFFSKLQGGNWCRVQFDSEKTAKELNAKINSITCPEELL